MDKKVAEEAAAGAMRGWRPMRNLSERFRPVLLPGSKRGSLMFELWYANQQMSNEYGNALRSVGYADALKR